MVKLGRWRSQRFLARSLAQWSGRESIEAGRIGSRNCAIVVLDALASRRGSNALLEPVKRVFSATAHRDRAFWDLRLGFRRAPSVLEIFPRDGTLRRAIQGGEREFEATARLLRVLLAPVPPWRSLTRRIRARAGAAG